ncbi:MAG: hypothetical protein KDE48_19240 [Anaerolineales bacterium]|nr:hypothetical protein [Anaerolineales bacterium]
MDIQFFDNPLQNPKSREDVRIKQIGLFVYDDLRRMAVGLELTPFLERPSIEINITNGKAEPAGSLNVIENLSPNFSLTMHLRDAETINPYQLTAIIYYATPETERVDVDIQTVQFALEQPGEMRFTF